VVFGYFDTKFLHIVPLIGKVVNGVQIRSPLLPFTHKTISQQKLAERKGNSKSRGSIKICHEIKTSPQVPPRWTSQQFQWVIYCLDGRDMWYNCLNNMMSQQSKVQNFPVWEKQKTDHKLYFSHWTKTKQNKYIQMIHCESICKLKKLS